MTALSKKTVKKTAKKTVKKSTKKPKMNIIKCKPEPDVQVDLNASVLQQAKDTLKRALQMLDHCTPCPVSGIHIDVFLHETTEMTDAQKNKFLKSLPTAFKGKGSNTYLNRDYVTYTKGTNGIFIGLD